MSELKSESNITSYFVTKGALAVLDSVSVILAKVAGLSEKERLDTIVSCSIPYLKFQSEDGNATRPIAFLSKYLGGSGDAETIDLYQLLAEDKGVRRSVHSQIKTFLSQELFFKDTGIDLSRSGRLSTAKSLGVSNAENAYRQKLTSLQCKELFIDIPQSDFQIMDWCNATGGIKLKWSLIDVREDKKAVFAKLWGSNTYRWHPEVPRKSQRLHQVLKRLKKFGAKEFEMVFSPCLISIATGDPVRA